MEREWRTGAAVCLSGGDRWLPTYILYRAEVKCMGEPSRLAAFCWRCSILGAAFPLPHHTLHDLREVYVCKGSLYMQAVR